MSIEDALHDELRVSIREGAELMVEISRPFLPDGDSKFMKEQMDEAAKELPDRFVSIFAKLMFVAVQNARVTYAASVVAQDMFGVGQQEFAEKVSELIRSEEEELSDEEEEMSDE